MPYGDTYRISLNPAYLGNADEACHVVTHELPHAGNAPDSGDEHGQGWDRVHSCTRMCTHTTNVPAGATPQGDCANCVESASARRACHVQYR